MTEPQTCESCGFRLAPRADGAPRKVLRCSNCLTRSHVETANRRLRNYGTLVAPPPPPVPYGGEPDTEALQSSNQRAALAARRQVT